MRKRLSVVVAIAVVVALAVPAVALATNWVRSPIDPLIIGGVHTTQRFIKLMTESTRMRTAVKKVVAADGLPYWVYNSAFAQAKAGKVGSAKLPSGTYIGAMAYGYPTIKIEKNTTWAGDESLPYYYVTASRTTTEVPYLVTRRYHVCVAKPCGNPFVVPLSSVKRRLYPLYVEKRSAAEGNPRLAGWQINGTVGGKPVSVTTNANGRTLVGYFLPGAAYDLEETAQDGWTPQNPQSGAWSGTMGHASKTLTWINLEQDIPQ